jgi:isopentenyl-diphosphate delta-isomerase
MSGTEKRKADHIEICSNMNVESGSTGFEDVSLVHQALPEMDFDEIDTTVMFLGKKFNAPLIIEAMTGGTEKAEKINKNLAKAAENLGIGMGIGSQRAGIEEPSLERTYQVRDVAPNIFLVANLGVVQFNKGYTAEHAKKAIDMIDADALALHLNPLQEAIQREGDLKWKHAVKRIEEISKTLEKPVIVKETGCGISKEVAKMLKGVSAVDIGGSGGTNFAFVENYRSPGMGYDFRSWGIPTAVSLVETVRTVNIPVICSGGMRSGQQICKALVLGASLSGLALPLLKPAQRSHKDVQDKLEGIIKELKVAMFLVGAKNIEELRKKPVIITGKTREWLELRGLDVRKYAMR